MSSYGTARNFFLQFATCYGRKLLPNAISATICYLLRQEISATEAEAPAPTTIFFHCLKVLRENQILHSDLKPQFCKRISSLPELQKQPANLSQLAVARDFCRSRKKKIKQNEKEGGRRIRILIENGVRTRHRSMFVIIGDKSRDQANLIDFFGADLGQSYTLHGDDRPRCSDSFGGHPNCIIAFICLYARGNFNTSNGFAFRI
ncbi:hypothetical protein Ccrd_010403 [Cynara cardunculus var. scolymus]|uniref:Uncharacterized protein n=1 Tax=Cynara cardunculus var. scolymus TaxID=59895 RepID=A0A118K6U0_CYNCS|nr:hypothetical protein Ccrd_010403 [Cynara cardunculus var. scolymus]